MILFYFNRLFYLNSATKKDRTDTVDLEDRYLPTATPSGGS